MVLYLPYSETIKIKKWSDKRNKLMRKYEKYAKTLQKQVKKLGEMEL
jgi:hypothetical protein